MTYPDEVLADAPAWWLRFGESSGAPQDASGNARHGTIVGTVTHGADGLLTEDANTAFAFASTGYVAVPFVTADDTSSFTAEAWVETASTTVDLEFFHAETSASGKRWRCKVDDTTGHFTFTWYDINGSTVDVAAPVVVNDGQPHHLVAVVAGETATLYVDGAEQVSSTRPSAWGGGLEEPSDFLIGAFREVSEGVGTIDEPAFYRTALSAARVTAHYTAGTETAAVPVEGVRRFRRAGAWVAATGRAIRRAGAWTVSVVPDPGGGGTPQAVTYNGAAVTYAGTAVTYGGS